MAALLPRFHLQLAGVITLGVWWDYPLNDALWRWWVARSAGSGLLLEDGTTYWLEPMCPVLLPPWRKSRTAIRSDVMQAYLGFLVIGLPLDWVRSAMPTVIALPKITNWATEAAYVANPTSATTATRLRMEALMATSIACALQHHDPDNECSGDALALSTINPALRAIDECLPRGIEVAELALISGVSVDHFTRLFKRGIGQTPHMYVRDRRILWAADYLSHVDDVEGAAERTGFANRHHFTTVFTQVMGLPPGRYRRSLTG